MRREGILHRNRELEKTSLRVGKIRATTSLYCLCEKEKASPPPDTGPGQWSTGWSPGPGSFAQCGTCATICGGPVEDPPKSNEILIVTTLP